jgi:hypothetical protein
MRSQRERRAAAFEAIAQSLLELAAIEREPEERPASEILIDRRNCESKLGLSPRAFGDAAGRDFPAYRVSRRLTATKADVLAWIKSRPVPTKGSRPPAATSRPTEDPDAMLKAVNARFVTRVGRPMTDLELHQAELKIEVGRDYAKLTGKPYIDTADDVAAKMQKKIGEESFFHREWRSLGLDAAAMERDAEALRQELYEKHPEMDWRARNEAVFEMWGKITEPLSEAQRAARAEKRAAKKAERAKLGQLGLRK